MEDSWEERCGLKRLVVVPFVRDPFRRRNAVEDREKVKPLEPDDVEAHKVKPARGEEAPTEEEGTDDDVEGNRLKSRMSDSSGTDTGAPPM